MGVDAPCLYNVSADPGEHEDLAGVQPDILAALLDRFAAFDGQGPRAEQPPKQLNQMCSAAKAAGGVLVPWGASHVTSTSSPAPVVSCQESPLQLEMNHQGKDYAHFACEDVVTCQARCCDDAENSDCGAFTWTSFQPRNASNCAQDSACCWLKRTKLGAFAPKLNCTSGEVTVSKQWLV